MRKNTRKLFRVSELFYILIMVTVTGLYIFTKMNQIVYLKAGDFCNM